MYICIIKYRSSASGIFYIPKKIKPNMSDLHAQMDSIASVQEAWNDAQDLLKKHRRELNAVELELNTETAAIIALHNTIKEASQIRQDLACRLSVEQAMQRIHEGGGGGGAAASPAAPQAAPVRVPSTAAKAHRHIAAVHAQLSSADAV